MWWFQPCLVQRLPWRTQHHEECKEPPEHPEQLIPKETLSHSWLVTDPKSWPQVERILHAFSQPGPLTFSSSWFFIKPGARILVLPPFRFLSLQPYRNSWVTSDKNTHKITMRTDVSRKEKPKLPAVLSSSAVLGRALIHSMNGGWDVLQHLS